MKFLSLAALFVALLLSGYSPAPALQRKGPAPRRPIVEPMVELHPRFDAPTPPPRQPLASLYAARLDALDDQVTNLKARCDLLSARAALDEDFERLKLLRSRVLVALIYLRDPMIGIDAAEQAVEASLSELRVTIDVLTVKVDSLGPPKMT